MLNSPSCDKAGKKAYRRPGFVDFEPGTIRHLMHKPLRESKFTNAQEFEGQTIQIVVKDPKLTQFWEMTTNVLFSHEQNTSAMLNMPKKDLRKEISASVRPTFSIFSEANRFNDGGINQFTWMVALIFRGIEIAQHGNDGVGLPWLSSRMPVMRRGRPLRTDSTTLWRKHCEPMIRHTTLRIDSCCQKSWERNFGSKWKYFSPSYDMVWLEVIVERPSDLPAAKDVEKI